MEEEDCRVNSLGTIWEGKKLAPHHTTKGIPNGLNN